MCVRYHPSGCQVITCGTNRQIGYWEVFDGSLIREIEGSKSSALNTLDITSDGMYVATGGSDQIVKIWKYKEGITTYMGLGHAAVITMVKFSPDYSTIVTASADGAIFIWKCPFGKKTASVAKSRESVASRSSCSLREAKLKQMENIKAISPTQSVRSNQEDKPTTPCSAGCMHLFNYIV
uniref:Cilia- and flagella-associated protein 52 n=1 Tax=Clastoptera arizonana TaxID=38151 RepID=A0A1B6CQV2_9HEMI